MHFAARLFSGELPPDGDTVTICASIPGFGLAAQRGDVPDPSPSQTLAAEKADLNLNLVQPASVRGHEPRAALHRYAGAVETPLLWLQSRGILKLYHPP